MAQTVFDHICRAAITPSDLAADLAALYRLQGILQEHTRHEDALATVRQRIAATEQMMGGATDAH